MTRIYFVRHAEAEGNLYRICEGQYDGLLTVFGRAQLPCVTDYFRDIRLDAVYSSDLYRARETAAAVAAASGLPVTLRRGLRELSFGAYEGLPWGDIFLRWPEAERQFREDYRFFAPPGGESTRQGVERLTAEIRALSARHPDGTIAVVGHSAVFGAFFPAITEGFDSVHAMKYMRNAAVNLVETDGEHFSILRFDDVSHLEFLEPDKPRRRSGIQFAYRAADVRRDEAYLRACGEDAWRAVYGSLAGFSSNRFFENTRGILNDREGNGFIPLADGKPAGLLLLDSRQDDEPETGHIALVYLRPEYRGLGLGAQLIGRAVIEYRARGMHTLRLNVATVNKTAQRFYQRLGFVPAPRLRRLVTRQQVMKLDIHVPHEIAQE